MDSSLTGVFKWFLYSSCTWEEKALAKLIESLGWNVEIISQSERAFHTEPDIDKACIVSLANSDITGENWQNAASWFQDIPLVIFVRDDVDPDAITYLPENVAAVITATLTETTISSVLHIVASGLRVVPRKGQYGRKGPNGSGKNGRSVPKPVVIEPKVLQSSSDSDEPICLTIREREIAKEICRGISDKEIARRLGIAVNTVNVHTSAIRRKMGVKNRTQIALRFSGPTHGGARFSGSSTLQANP
jgi:DNA-binding NarL/FixJ family response regulator